MTNLRNLLKISCATITLGACWYIYNKVTGKKILKDVTDGISEKHLSRPDITNYEENIPDKGDNIRVGSFNIASSYIDDLWDKTPKQIHHWKNRTNVVKKFLLKINLDILCVQELSVTQAKELNDFLQQYNYQSAFLCQTPSEIPAGEIVFNNDINKWDGKNTGTFLNGIFIDTKKYHFSKVNRFWLNENPEQQPSKFDKGGTDKGFGNMKSYRAVIWTEITDNNDNSLFIFNSHYPVSGGSKARFHCAKIEKEQIKKIAGNKFWISVGDRNLITQNTDDETYNPETVYNELVKNSYDFRDSSKHYGSATTWIGFSNDPYKNMIESNDFTDGKVLDIGVSNKISLNSFHLIGAYNPKNMGLLENLAPCEAQNEDRYFVSDHTLIGADFALDSLC